MIAAQVFVSADMEHPDSLDIVADMVRQGRSRFVLRGGRQGHARPACSQQPGYVVFMV
jgi:hypothetical protein